MKPGIVLLLGLICIVLSAEDKSLNLPVIGVGRVSTVEDTNSRSYVGRVVAIGEVRIVSQVAGEILEVAFKDGAFVRKGDVLYKIDQTQYGAAVKNIEAKIEECQARMTYAMRAFERKKTLYSHKAVSQDEMENFQSAFDIANAALLSAQAERITAVDNLNHTTIFSPLDGFAGVTNFTAGNYVSPNSGILVTIVQDKPIRVGFSIGMADFLSTFGSRENARLNGVVRIKLADGTIYPETGIIELLNNVANDNTDTVQIYAQFSNVEGKLFPGCAVTVTLSLKKGQCLPAIPPSAIMHDEQGAYAYVVDRTNRVEKRYIIPGSSISHHLQIIRNGLKEGEQVITEGTHKVEVGSNVEISKK